MVDIMAFADIENNFAKKGDGIRKKFAPQSSFLLKLIMEYLSFIKMLISFYLLSYPYEKLDSFTEVYVFCILHKCIVFCYMPRCYVHKKRIFFQIVYNLYHCI